MKLAGILLKHRVQHSLNRTIGAVQPAFPFVAEIKKCEGSRTATQREFIAKRTICLAWPEPHTWFAAVIKSPSVISFLCLFSMRHKITPEIFP